MSNSTGIIILCIAGVTLGALLILLCIFSVIKAIRDRRRIIAKNKSIRQQKLLYAESELGGGSLPLPPVPIIPEINEPESDSSDTEPQPRQIRLASAPNLNIGRRGSAFSPPPDPIERRWEKEGLEYCAQGSAVHIHRTMSSTGDKFPSGTTKDDKGNRLSTGEGTLRQRSASADIQRPLLPNGEPDRTATLLPSPKPTIASVGSNNTSIQVQVTTHSPTGNISAWV